jgi:RimJ/RimL family protein N-acetyltransferase
MRVVATERLRLEPQVAAHAEEMMGVLGDPAIYEHENLPPPSVDWLRARFERLEARSSPDGRELWLNWVLRLSSSEPIGYVQATVHPDRHASIAYVLASKFWGRGLAQEAVRAMILELVEFYQVRNLTAVLKAPNHRSRRLLERLGFSVASPDVHTGSAVEPDELLMVREAGEA